MSWQRLNDIEVDIETHKQEIKKLKVLRNKELGALRDLHKDMSALIQQLQSLMKREQTRQVLYISKYNYLVFLWLGLTMKPYVE